MKPQKVNLRIGLSPSGRPTGFVQSLENGSQLVRFTSVKLCKEEVVTRDGTRGVVYLCACGETDYLVVVFTDDQTKTWRIEEGDHEDQNPSDS